MSHDRSKRKGGELTSADEVELVPELHLVELALAELLQPHDIQPVNLAGSCDATIRGRFASLAPMQAVCQVGRRLQRTGRGIRPRPRGTEYGWSFGRVT